MILKLLAFLGFIELVWLEDFDGQVTLARKHTSPFGKVYAFRWSFVPERICFLLPDGTVNGPSYVHRWKDYK